MLRVRSLLSEIIWTPFAGTCLDPLVHPPPHYLVSSPPPPSSRVRDVRRDLVMRHDVVAPHEGVGAGVTPLLALPFLVLLEVAGGELLPARRAAGRASRALGPLVAFHPIAAVAVSAAMVATLYPGRAMRRAGERESWAALQGKNAAALNESKSIRCVEGVNLWVKYADIPQPRTSLCCWSVWGCKNITSQ